MTKKFAEHSGLDLTKVNNEILEMWNKNDIFHKSIDEREGCPQFVFFEGPPSANGHPGIHHVLARSIKDTFNRYKTMKGMQVHRKAGWDTHGLPVELGVEKELGITKADIDNKESSKYISVEDYNHKCRENVMKFTAEWRKLTEEMGYFVDLDHPYITYENKYIETLWWLLKQLYSKDLLYKGYTIQPYSPGAGTGLSSHELNQPGCYRDVKHTTVTAQFSVKDNGHSVVEAIKADEEEDNEDDWVSRPPIVTVMGHVDHGKTTLVDKMMLAGNLFRDGQDLSGQVLDSNDLERERGITILSKNVSINWKGTKINIIDTPGHSDFGGEVERVLNMADGCLLLVDAFEGPMPQTRFVLQKALQIGLKPIVVVNKVDKPNCRPEEVYEMVFDLMFSLNATEDQLDFPVVYGSAKNGWMSEDWKQPTDNITYLLDKIVEVIPAPKVIEGTPQMLITSLDYSSYTGRIAVGRVHRGYLKDGQQVTICHRDGSQEKTKIKELCL